VDRHQQAAETALFDQENLLPRKQLIFTFSLLEMFLLVMFIDQNGIGQLLPTIAKDLNATQTMSWAGTSALIGNTVFQVLYGRLSDIFGRKVVYLSALSLRSFSDLMYRIAKNAPMLYFFRGLAGVAGGGITSLSVMIVSDIVTLQRRGKYQGILGSMVG
jgi:MFS family permease